MAALKVISDICPPRAAGKTRGLSWKRGRALRSFIASWASGTRCSRSAFILKAGTIHKPDSKSNSSQRAPRTYCDIAAVSATNSKARAPKPSRMRSAANQTGASSICNAGCICVFGADYFPQSSPRLISNGSGLQAAQLLFQFGKENWHLHCKTVVLVERILPHSEFVGRI